MHYVIHNFHGKYGSLLVCNLKRKLICYIEERPLPVIMFLKELCEFCANYGLPFLSGDAEYFKMGLNNGQRL